jgi:hypothetical protein
MAYTAGDPVIVDGDKVGTIVTHRGVTMQNWDLGYGSGIDVVHVLLATGEIRLYDVAKVQRADQGVTSQEW